MQPSCGTCTLAGVFADWLVELSNPDDRCVDASTNLDDRCVDGLPLDICADADGVAAAISCTPPGVWVADGSLVLAEISGYPPCQGRICTGRGSIVALRLGLRDRLSGPLAGPDALAPSSQPRNSVISTIAAPVLPAVPLQPNILIGNATGHTITFSRLSRSTKHNKINQAKYDHALSAFLIN